MNKVNWEIEFHLPLEDMELEESNKFATAMMSAFEGPRSGEYTGEEVRENEVVHFFSTTEPEKVIKLGAQYLRSCALGKSSFVTLTSEYGTVMAEDTPIASLDIEAWLARHKESFRKRPVQNPSRRPKVGDYYAIPLPGGRFGYAYFLQTHPDSGDLVEILCLLTDEPVTSIATLRGAKPIFGPMLTSVKVCTSVGGWKRVGHFVRPEEFIPPMFRNSFTAFLKFQSGVYHDWHLREYGNDVPVFVGELTEDQRRLQFEVSVSPAQIAERIETGKWIYDEFL